MSVKVGDWVEYRAPGGCTFVAEVQDIQGSWIYLGKERGVVGRFCRMDDIITTRRLTHHD